MKKSKLQNTTTIDITGKRIIPNLYTSHAGDYLPGDILDANSVMSKVNEAINVKPKHAATTDKTLANPGDLVIGTYDENDNYVVTFVDPLEAEKYSIIEEAMEGVGPIGIVVVPASHTTDGTVRIASIKYMDFNNSADGADSAVDMCWGYDNAIVDASTMSNKIVTYVQGTTTVSLVDYSTFATTDTKITFFENIDDPDTYYSWGSQWSGRIPSPYNADDTKNTLWDTAGQILVYRDGKALTQAIKNKTTWNIGDTIINVSNNANMYPAAFSCLNYNVAPDYFDGAFSQGNWYLPSIAELGYLMARFKEINATRQAVGADLLYDKFYWSSSEHSQLGVWSICTDDGGAFSSTPDGGKRAENQVLAFVAF